MHKRNDLRSRTAAERCSPRNTVTNRRLRRREIERLDWWTRPHVPECCPAIGANPSSEFTNPPSTPAVLMTHSRSCQSFLCVCNTRCPRVVGVQVSGKSRLSTLCVFCLFVCFPALVSLKFAIFHSSSSHRCCSGRSRAPALPRCQRGG